MNNEYYTAANAGVNTEGKQIWMVKWFKQGLDGGYVESLIITDLTNGNDVIEFAKRRGSWA